MFTLPLKKSRASMRISASCCLLPSYAHHINGLAFSADDTLYSLSFELVGRYLRYRIFGIFFIINVRQNVGVITHTLPEGDFCAAFSLKPLYLPSCYVKHQNNCSCWDGTDSILHCTVAYLNDGGVLICLWAFAVCHALSTHMR